ncbi:MAG TPA: hypothetical protein VF622_11945 [Segetibacter sp.]|jgi:hypothetical protein
MIEQIVHNNTLIAIIIRGEHKKDGVEFFTPHSFSQQLGYMKRPKGYFIEPHTHRIVERKVSHTQEVLHVKSGKIKITLFGNDRAFISEVVFYQGDTVLLAAGGHSVEMLEDSELIEIKQGPYLNDEDKVRFYPAMANNERRDRN